MKDFPHLKVNKMSLAYRGLVFGIGINDSDYLVRPNIEGETLICPYYRKWKGMIQRCNSEAFYNNNPTYRGCTVSEEWVSFMSFRSWMVKQDWEGMQLDKDLKIKGNSVYSSETCLFIPASLNTLLNNCPASRGKSPVGVAFEADRRKYKASIQINGKSKNLGRFKTQEEASKAYQKARKEKIEKIISDNLYPMATAYLEQHI